MANEAQDAVVRWLQSAPPEVRDHLLGHASPSAAAHPTQKQAKASVNYRHADDPAESCGGCQHFDGTGGCAIVAGQINPDWVCDQYSAKAGNADGDTTTASEPNSDSASSSGDSADDSGDE